MCKGLRQPTGNLGRDTCTKFQAGGGSAPALLRVTAMSGGPQSSFLKTVTQNPMFAPTQLPCLQVPFLLTRPGPPLSHHPVSAG